MRRPSARAAALGLGALTLLLIAASVPLDHYAHRPFPGGGGGLGVAALFLPFAAVGVLVAYRQPRNPIGWILVVLALSMVGSGAAGDYSVIAFRLGHPGLPLARLATALTQTWIGLVLLLPLPIVLFPDGHLPSRRWRWTFWLYLVLAGCFFADIAIRDAGAFTDRVVRVDSSGELQNFAGPSGPAAGVLAALYALVVVSWIVGKIVEYRRSSGVHRQQLKWLMLGGCVSIVALLVTLSVNGSIAFVGVAALPISIGVGILKYRLYDIDRLISRTVSYAIVTGSLVAVFLGLVVLTTDVLPFSSPVGVAASTLAAAALFTPLRRRVQRTVDRRFNRARYDAETTVEAFSRRLRDAVDLETVQTSLVAAVDQAVKPAHLTVWIRSGA